MKALSFAGQLDIFSIRENRYLRTCGGQGELSGLEENEYFSFSLMVRNHGDRDFAWQQAQVSVDGAPPDVGEKGSCRLPAAPGFVFRTGI